MKKMTFAQSVPPLLFGLCWVVFTSGALGQANPFFRVCRSLQAEMESLFNEQLPVCRFDRYRVDALSLTHEIDSKHDSAPQAVSRQGVQALKNNVLLKSSCTELPGVLQQTVTASSDGTPLSPAEAVCRFPDGSMVSLSLFLNTAEGISNRYEFLNRLQKVSSY